MKINENEDNFITMNTLIKNNNTQRYCSVEESLIESLREVKLHIEGKIKLKTWDEYVKSKVN